jgi:RNA polymerase primary sigma factor
MLEFYALSTSNPCRGPIGGTLVAPGKTGKVREPLFIRSKEKYFRAGRKYLARIRCSWLRNDGLPMTSSQTFEISARPQNLDCYFREVGRTSLLNAEEELELGRRIQKGDFVARERMVSANLRLVVKIAKRYLGRGVELDDLISEGNLGLVHAAEYYDPEVGVRFSTYCQYWIKQSMDRLIKNSGKSIRIPSYMHQMVKNWNIAARDLERELGRKPNPEETAKRLGLSALKLKHLVEAIRIYNATPQQQGEEVRTSLAEMIADHRIEGSTMEASEELQRVLRCVDSLPDERARAVLRMRFGLNGHKPMVLREVGGKLGLTRERVRQIENQALALLRERLTV